MKATFNSEQEANDYKTKHQLFGRVPEKIVGAEKWALNFPIEAHVTIHQPHSPELAPPVKGRSPSSASLSR